MNMLIKKKFIFFFIKKVSKLIANYRFLKQIINNFIFNYRCYLIDEDFLII